MSESPNTAEIRDALEGWLQGQIPKATALELTNFQSPKIGYSSTTLLFELTAQIGDETRTEPLVLRMEPQGIPLFSESDLRPQYRIMKALANSEVPVPRMRWFEEDDSVLGSPFYIMDRVSGEVPADNPPYHREGWLADQSPTFRREVWLSGVTTLAKIHRLDIDQYDLAFLDEPDRGPTPIEQHLQLYEQHFEWGLERERFPLLVSALAWLHDNRPPQEPTALTWGDARISNLIYQGSECVAVLDWEMARLGNPVQDIAYWLVLDRSLSEGIGMGRLEGLPDEQETLRHWEDTSGYRADAESLRFYKIFCGLVFTFVMARVMTREKQKGTMPADNPYDVDNLASQALAKMLLEVGAIHSVR